MLSAAQRVSPGSVEAMVVFEDLMGLLVDIEQALASASR
jgi:hypothetical protein